MIQINDLDEGLEIFKALGSDARMRIVELLSERGEMNLNEMASALGLTNGAITQHIRTLESCGIISVQTEATSHGNQKICTLAADQILLNLQKQSENYNLKVYEAEIPVGHYIDYRVKPSCGLASSTSQIGDLNTPLSFALPERLNAQLVWFHDGYVEYRIPYMVPEDSEIVQMTISLEISAADQGSEDANQSYIHFQMNGKRICDWLSIENADNARGIYTPGWWDRTKLQHGYLKMLVISANGAFLDGVPIHDCEPGILVPDEYGEFRFRIYVESTEGFDGGAAVYGSAFGNYNQNINVRFHYVSKEVWDGIIKRFAE